VLQRQEVFVAGNNIRSLGALRRGNDHIVIRITDDYGHLGYITHEAGKDTQSLNKIAGCLIRIMVALTMASLLIKKHPLGFVKYLFREVQEKSSFTGMAKELVRHAALDEEGADEDGGVKHGAGHGRGDIL
jgi:hypothetical protein